MTTIGMNTQPRNKKQIDGAQNVKQKYPDQTGTWLVPSNNYFCFVS
jgi:hypothetical protein